MKKRVLLVILLFITNFLFSQNMYKLKGTIVEENGELIVGAKVETEDGYVCRTNFDGTFEINTYNCDGKIKVSYYGFKTDYFPYYFDNKTKIELQKSILFKL